MKNSKMGSIAKAGAILNLVFGILFTLLFIFGAVYSSSFITRRGDYEFPEMIITFSVIAFLYGMAVIQNIVFLKRGTNKGRIFAGVVGLFISIIGGVLVLADNGSSNKETAVVHNEVKSSETKKQAKPKAYKKMTKEEKVNDLLDKGFTKEEIVNILDLDDKKKG